MPYYPSQPDKQPSEDSSRKRKQILLRRMTVGVSLLLLVYGAARLIGYAADLVKSRQTARELREIAAEPDTTVFPAFYPQETEIPFRTESAPSALQTVLPDVAPSVPPTVRPESGKLPPVNYPKGYELVPRIKRLHRKSEYIFGWLTMDGLDEPVAKKDNSFFLNHDATGKRNVNGSLFMDEDTSLLTRPYTILVFGHNMKSGAMFGNLRKYEEFSYFYRHRVFRFDTLYEEGQYAVFAVETISLTPGKSRYVNLTDLQSSDRKARQGALKVLMNHSLHSPMLDVNEEDQLLLLITCVGDDDERFVVTARRLRDGEQADRLIMN